MQWWNYHNPICAIINKVTKTDTVKDQREKNII